MPQIINDWKSHCHLAVNFWCSLLLLFLDEKSVHLKGFAGSIYSQPLGPPCVYVWEVRSSQWMKIFCLGAFFKDSIFDCLNLFFMWQTCSYQCSHFMILLSEQASTSWDLALKCTKNSIGPNSWNNKISSYFRCFLIEFAGGVGFYALFNCSVQFRFWKQNFDWLVLFGLGRMVNHCFGYSLWSDGINQFLLKIQAFWCKICPCSCFEQKGKPWPYIVFVGCLSLI